MAVFVGTVTVNELAIVREAGDPVPPGVADVVL